MVHFLMYIDIAAASRTDAEGTSFYETHDNEDDDGRGEIALEISPAAVFLRGNRELIQNAFKSHQRTQPVTTRTFP